MQFMKRREFVGWVSVGGVVVGTITACKTNTSQQAASEPRADGFHVVGSVNELDQNGQILANDVDGHSVLVVRDPQANDQLLAVNPTCTHAGCIVNWTSEQDSFICPCHGSIFSSDGVVVKGPADKPLPSFVAQIDGSSVIVKPA